MPLDIVEGCISCLRSQQAVVLVKSDGQKDDTYDNADIVEDADYRSCVTVPEVAVLQVDL
jgi:hypothetical protein